MTELEMIDEISRLAKCLDISEKEKSVYENGDAKLYYALQRKMSEMANTLNLYNLEDCDLDDPKNKQFDRITIILQKCETIAASSSALGVIAGVTGNQKKDTEKKPFVDRIAEKRD